jgi:3-oxoacyl-[acyl-carrier-protein] synthase-3
MRVRIVGTGLHLPATVETAADLSPRVGRSEKWILSRTGVAERRIADLRCDEMAALAGKEALGDGGPPDLVINASLTPVQLIPDTSVFVLKAMGLEGIPSFSIHATCLSFLVALKTATALIQTGTYRRILIVSSEQGSVCRDFDHPESAVLIGDGAAAIVLEPCENDEPSEMLGWKMSTWPSGSDLAELRGCGVGKHPNNPETRPEDNLFRMNGPRIYRMAVGQLEEAVFSLLDEQGVKFEDIDLVVPHQASGPALAAMPRYGGYDADKMVNIIDKFGNCIAASLPMALAYAHREGRLTRGDIVLMMGTGAGLSVGAILLRW